MSLWKLRRIHWTGGEQRRRSTRRWWGLRGSTCVCLAPVPRLRGCSHGWGGCWTKEGWACQGRLCRCSCSWKTTWFCEHLFHFDSCICTLLFDKYKKGYNRRLIEYGHLVLGTRSAAKFEQVPRSNTYRAAAQLNIIPSTTSHKRFLMPNDPSMGRWRRAGPIIRQGHYQDRWLVSLLQVNTHFKRPFCQRPYLIVKMGPSRIIWWASFWILIPYLLRDQKVSKLNFLSSGIFDLLTNPTHILHDH